VELARAETFGDDVLTTPVLDPGAYVLEVYDGSNVFGDFVGDPPIGDICIDVAVAP
jgi:hypothetical protein